MYALGIISTALSYFAILAFGFLNIYFFNNIFDFISYTHPNDLAFSFRIQNILYYLCYNLATPFYFILMILFFTSRYGMVSTALAWLPTIICVQLLCLYFIRDIFHDRLIEIRRPLFAIFLATFACARTSYVTIHVFPNIPGLIISSLLAALVTGMILWISDNRYSLGLMRNIAITFPQVASVLKMRNIKIK